MNNHKVDYWEVKDGTAVTFGMNDDVTPQQILEDCSKFGFDMSLKSLADFLGLEKTEELAGALILKGVESVARDYMFKQVWNSLNYNYEKKQELFKANSFLSMELEELKKKGRE